MLNLILPLALFLGSEAIPPKLFANYRELFEYIADAESLPKDPETVFKLAAESSISVHQVKVGDFHLVIRADFHGDGYVSTIRGAQGNGTFYVLHRERGGLRLIGTMFGNGYVPGSLNGQLYFKMGAHMSAGSSPESIYRVVGDSLVLDGAKKQ